MANGQGGLAPGLSGFRTQRKDKMQRQQHGMEMAQAKQGMQATAQQMRQRREQIERLKMENENYRKREDVREANRALEERKAELDLRNTDWRIDNFEERKQMEQLETRLSMEESRANIRKSQAEAQQDQAEMRRNGEEYLVNQIPEDPSQITQRKLRRWRNALTAMGVSPDQMGLPSELNDANRALIAQRRQEGVNTVEQEQRKDRIAYEASLQGGSQIRDLQQERARVRGLIDNLDNPAGEEGDRLRQQEQELTAAINEQTAITGSTEHDPERNNPTDNRVDDIESKVDAGQRAIDKIDQLVSMVRQNPQLAGIQGAVGGFTQSAAMQGKDILSMLIGTEPSLADDEFIEDTRDQYRSDAEAGRIEESLANMDLFNPNYPRSTQLQHALKYQVLRMRTEGKRPTEADMRGVGQETQLTGFTSAPDFLTRMLSLRGQVSDTIGSLQERQGRSPAESQQQGELDRQARSQNEEVERTQVETELHQYAQSQFDSNVKEYLEHPEQDGTFAELENGMIIDQNRNLIANKNFPDTINDMDLSNFESRHYHRPSGRYIYRFKGGDAYWPDGTRVDME